MNIAVADFGSAKRCAIACALQQSHAADWTGVFWRIIHDFTDWDGFFLLVSFVFCLFSLSISLFFLFFFLEHDCLLCAICDMWLRVCRNARQRAISVSEKEAYKGVETRKLENNSRSHCGWHRFNGGRCLTKTFLFTNIVPSQKSMEKPAVIHFVLEYTPGSNGFPTLPQVA